MRFADVTAIFYFFSWHYTKNLRYSETDAKPLERHGVKLKLTIMGTVR